MKRFLATILLSLTLTTPTLAKDCSKQDSAVQCLACNIYHEARGEDLRGMMAVALVTVNRMESGEFPDSICRVVWQSGPQFSWTQDGESDQMSEPGPARQSMQVALMVLANTDAHYETTGLNPNVMWFHNGSVKPDWMRRFDRVARIGGHTFYEKP